MTILKPSIH